MRHSPDPAMIVTDEKKPGTEATGKTDTPPSLPEGMQSYVDAFRAAQGGSSSLSAARLHSDMGAAAFRTADAVPVPSFTTFIVLEGREIGVRIYRPGGDTPKPGVCYFHGGGFMFGSIETFDTVAAGLAEEIGAVVASVQYRRLPENRYDDAQDDCYAALAWLGEHAGSLGIDPARLCVAGDSVGALMATTAAMQARDHGGPALACQILLYGAFALESGRTAYERSRDPLLTGANVEKFIDLYHRTRGASQTYAPPLAADDLGRLPPAIVIGAEHDPLCDEALEYAARLARAGTRVETHIASGMIHGFLRARAMSPAAAHELTSIAAMAHAHLRPEPESDTQQSKEDTPL